MVILKFDPTRTTTLRRKYQAEMRRRFYTVRSLVVKAIWKLDVLGLNENEPFTFNQELLVSNALPERQVWRFRTDAQKLTAFKGWLQEQIDQEILSVDVVGNPWSATYIDSSYRRGVIRAYSDTHVQELADIPDFYQGSRAQFLESSFSQAERLDKLKFLYTRSFEELQGITSAMSQQMGRILANGIANGRGARIIARELSNNITGITKQRAMVLARTELAAAHAEGQLDALEELGIEKVVAMIEWSTADNPCELCADMNGAIFTIKEARGLIPRHPNCLCAWIPANVGERSNKAILKARGQNKGKIKASLKSELPKKTRAGKKVPQTVKEAKRRSTWAGKEL